MAAHFLPFFAPKQQILLAYLFLCWWYQLDCDNAATMHRMSSGLCIQAGWLLITWIGTARLGTWPTTLAKPDRRYCCFHTDTTTQHLLLVRREEHKKQIAEWSQKCIPVKILAQTQIHINTTFLTNRAHIHTRHTSETTKARLAYNSSISIPTLKQGGVSIKKDIHPSGRFHHRQQRQWITQ